MSYKQGATTNGFSISGLDLKSAASTKIFTTPNNGSTFFPTMCRVYCTAANTVAVVASLSFGTNSATYNNILAISALTGVTTSGLYIDIPIVLGTAIAANTDVYVKVTTGATATSQSGTVMIFGDYGV